MTQLSRLIDLLPPFSHMMTPEQQAWWFEAWLELYRMAVAMRRPDYEI